MSWWRKTLRIVAKVGEEAVEVASVATHVNNLEDQIMSLKSNPFATPGKITEMLGTIKAIRSGVNDVRH